MNEQLAEGESATIFLFALPAVAIGLAMMLKHYLPAAVGPLPLVCFSIFALIVDVVSCQDPSMCEWETASFSPPIVMDRYLYRPCSACDAGVEVSMTRLTTRDRCRGVPLHEESGGRGPVVRASQLGGWRVGIAESSARRI